MKNFHHVTLCPVRDVLSRLSSKWAMLILETLRVNGVMRFGDIQKSIGDISQRMLTVTLRMLEQDGFVYRQVYPEVPPRVEYGLTERASSLMPYMEGLIGWAVENMPQIVEDRKRNEGDAGLLLEEQS